MVVHGTRVMLMSAHPAVERDPRPLGGVLKLWHRSAVAVLLSLTHILPDDTDESSAVEARHCLQMLFA